MEILRHGRSLQPESEMSLHAGQHRDKYFYDGNDFLETNEGDKAIREILHLLEEREETYQSAGEESGTSLHHFLQHAILCASILCVILIIAIFLVHRKHSRHPQTNNEVGRARDTVIVVSDVDDTDTLVCDNTSKVAVNQTTFL